MIPSFLCIADDCCASLKFALDNVMAGPSILRFKTGGTSLLADILIFCHRQTVFDDEDDDDVPALSMEERRFGRRDFRTDLRPNEASTGMEAQRRNDL